MANPPTPPAENGYYWVWWAKDKYALGALDKPEIVLIDNLDTTRVVWALGIENPIPLDTIAQFVTEWRKVADATGTPPTEQPSI